LTTDNEQAASPASDDMSDDDVLSIEMGDKTIAAHLDSAIASGGVVRRPDGKFELVTNKRDPYIKYGKFAPHCRFLFRFMFFHIYGKKAVPIGCRDCYKIKVTPDTLRQLIAVKDIAEHFPAPSKSGSEVDKGNNQSIYASYFYFLGLDKARSVYRTLRNAIDLHPKLGPDVKMVIKRGCTEYEHACGPSNRYTFDSRLADIEEYFWARFVREKPDGRPKKYRDAMVLLDWVRTAYRIGDDTYKDVTGGKDLFPSTVSYDPDVPSTAGDDSPAEEEASGRHSISK
jgi:hypothetical protein